MKNKKMPDHAEAKQRGFGLVNVGRKGEHRLELTLIKRKELIKHFSYLKQTIDPAAFRLAYRRFFKALISSRKFTVTQSDLREIHASFCDNGIDAPVWMNGLKHSLMEHDHVKTINGISFAKNLLQGRHNCISFRNRRKKDYICNRTGCKVVNTKQDVFLIVHPKLGELCQVKTQESAILFIKDYIR